MIPDRDIWRAANLLIVNAGAKMYRRTGVKMHHGGLPA
jgi:hypothetical protein